MSSPMPLFPHMCAICFEGIEPGDHAEDEEGLWDVHSGECAVKAGISELPRR